MMIVLKNWFYYFAGIVFLILANVKFRIRGYNPKAFTVREAQRCTEYDIGIVDRWIEHLHLYTGEDRFGILKDKRVLELGPGSDLGVGLYILSKSAKEYNAVDIFNLVENVPDEFYTVFFSNLQERNIDTAPLIKELEKTKNGNNDRLNYCYRKDFDIVSALGPRMIDIIFSHASFEHFNDIFRTIEEVSKVAVKGARFIVSVDLQTHSRWIRQKDPNNIYRYTHWLYNLLSVPSSPNRERPYRYQEALEKNGWTDIKIVPEHVLTNDKHGFVKKHLNKHFLDDKNQMNYLTVYIYATKS